MFYFWVEEKELYKYIKSVLLIIIIYMKKKHILWGIALASLAAVATIAVALEKQGKLEQVKSKVKGLCDKAKQKCKGKIKRTQEEVKEDMTNASQEL